MSQDSGLAESGIGKASSNWYQRAWPRSTALAVVPFRTGMISHVQFAGSQSVNGGNSVSGDNAFFTRMNVPW